MNCHKTAGGCPTSSAASACCFCFMRMPAGLLIDASSSFKVAALTWATKSSFLHCCNSTSCCCSTAKRALNWVVTSFLNHWCSAVARNIVTMDKYFINSLHVPDVLLLFCKCFFTSLSSLALLVKLNLHIRHLQLAAPPNFV
jgi:hypothetical protein